MKVLICFVTAVVLYYVLSAIWPPAPYSGPIFRDVLVLSLLTLGFYILWIWTEHDAKSLWYPLIVFVIFLYGPGTLLVALMKIITLALS